MARGTRSFDQHLEQRQAERDTDTVLAVLRKAKEPVRTGVVARAAGFADPLDAGPMGSDGRMRALAVLNLLLWRNAVDRSTTPQGDYLWSLPPAS